MAELDRAYTQEKVEFAEALGKLLHTQVRSSSASKAASPQSMLAHRAIEVGGPPQLQTTTHKCCQPPS